MLMEEIRDAFGNAIFADAGADTSSASRLAFLTNELARYAGTQFKWLFDDIIRK